MGKKDTVEVLLITLSVSGAVLLMVTAYLIYIRRFIKRGKMKILNNVVLHTSRYDTYHSATKFLLELPKKSTVDFSLLDSNENFINTILKADLEAGEYPIAFDPALLENGTYYLELKTEN